MNVDLVVVKSKTINHESIPIVFNIVEVRHGEIVDKREISRSYVFEDFEAKIPLKHAKILVKQYPKEFKIVKSASKEPSKKVANALAKVKEVEKGFICPICGKVAENKAGLSAHIRFNHPEEWKKQKMSKVEKKTKEEK